MSWFNRGGSFRASKRRSSSPSLPKELDANACLESFKTHWQQVFEIVSKQGPQNKMVKADHIRAVMIHIDQMVTLLLHDVQISENAMGPILDYMLSEDVLEKILSWSLKTGENVNALKLEQLKLYEVLISHSHQQLLIHKPILNPLIKLLQVCSECGPVDVEKRLVILLNQLCVSLTQNEMLMDFFFSVSSQQGPSRFLIFNLLIPFVHREGGIGQQARDALLLCMSLSRKNDSMGIYIAEHSTFCPILATGLSGLYSLLPRKLMIQTEDWHRLTPDDLHDIPELAMFMNSFEFCNAVIQASHLRVQEQLLDLFNKGFLIPVLGPALHQTSVDEIITATAYLDLFLRSITEPLLMQAFLQFIFKETHDGSLIIDTIISRIAIQTRLCLVTLALVRTLLELNCEDVMFHLVFRYLIPCTHVMVSQRCRIKDFDIYCKTAEKFLALIPACCQPESAEDDESASDHDLHAHGTHKRSFTVPEVALRQKCRTDSDSYRTNYMDYLQEAREGIKGCMQSCSLWTFPYDGSRPSPEQLKTYILHKNNQEDTPEESALKSLTNFSNINHKKCTKNDNDEFNQVVNDKPTHHNKMDKNDDQITEDTVDADPGTKIDASVPLENSPAYNNAISEAAEENTDLKTITSTSSSVSNRVPTNVPDSDLLQKNTQAEIKTDGSIRSHYDLSDHTEDQSSDDKLFWSILQDCQTPPPATTEESICEIETILAVLEKTSGNAHNCNNIQRLAIKTDFCGSFKPESISNSFENIIAAESRYLPLIIPEGQFTHADSQDKLQSNHVFHGHPEAFGSPDTGPFLGVLFNKLENMMNNNLYINLQLTGVIARLAYFPQPLLRSFLLNHTLVFQPTVKSLLQILGSLKHKMDNYSSSIDNFSNLLERARKFLKARDDRLLSDKGLLRPSEAGHRRSSSPDDQRDGRKRTLTDIIFRRPSTSNEKHNQTSRDITLDGIPDGTGYRYINRPFPDAPDGKLESLKTKNAVLCAVVLEEFLKELSAVTQEHSVAELDRFNFITYFTESNGMNIKFGAI